MTDVSPQMKLLEELLSGQRLAVLSTHSKGQPYSNLVAFAATQGLKDILFATTRATRKFDNITEDSRVAMLIDNRSNQVEDFHDAAAVTATGTAEELKGENREKYVEIYLNKHPYMKEFVMSPTCALLRVTVDKYYLVTQFQKVMVLSPK